MRLVKARAYPSTGGSRGGTRGGAAPSLVLDQTYGRRVEKNFLDTGLPAYLRVWMTRGPLLISRSGSGTTKGILSSMSRSSISKSSLRGFQSWQKSFGAGGGVKKPRIQGFYELFYSHPFLASPPSQASVYLHQVHYRFLFHLPIIHIYIAESLQRDFLTFHRRP